MFLGLHSFPAALKLAITDVPPISCGMRSVAPSSEDSPSNVGGEVDARERDKVLLKILAKLGGDA